MGLAVISVASGGLPVVEAGSGLAVTEAANLRGIAVTKVVGKPGMPVKFVNADGGPAVTFTTWNPADLLRVALTNGNLTATNTTTTQPSGVRSVSSFSTGKYYWEATAGPWNSFSTDIGMGNASQAFNGAALGSGGIFLNKDGAIYRNGSASGMPTFGIRAAGNVIGIAVDLTARLIWFRLAPAGNWNNSGTANPATAVGGVDVSSITGALFPTYLPYTLNDAFTANFGGSAFSGTVPSGFTAGWPA